MNAFDLRLLNRVEDLQDLDRAIEVLLRIADFLLTRKTADSRPR